MCKGYVKIVMCVEQTLLHKANLQELNWFVTKESQNKGDGQVGKGRFMYHCFPSQSRACSAGSLVDDTLCLVTFLGHTEVVNASYYGLSVLLYLADTCVQDKYFYINATCK